MNEERDGYAEFDTLQREREEDHFIRQYPAHRNLGGEEREVNEMEERMLELYFVTGTGKEGFQVPDDCTIEEVYQELSDAHVFEAGKPVNQIKLVRETTNESYRSNDTRTLRDLGIETGEKLFVNYDLNVAAEETMLELYFVTGTAKEGFQVPDDCTIHEVYQELSDAHVFEAGKQVNQLQLVRETTKES